VERLVVDEEVGQRKPRRSEPSYFVIYTPGHTDDSIAAAFDSKVEGK
jgi:hypothetical protein